MIGEKERKKKLFKVKKKKARKRKWPKPSKRESKKGLGGKCNRTKWRMRD